MVAGERGKVVHCPCTDYLNFWRYVLGKIFGEFKNFSDPILLLVLFEYEDKQRTWKQL